ncbi:hypothetical protein [Streptomyces sp. NPDC003023]|uniref:hypothetical protein n=1 Tax=Streptomyces sp. NPDC003023 TaxID=3364675 RepID=UPI0036B6849D
MQYVAWGVFFAVGMAVAGSGVVELLTGWIHPWERANVVRPVPHGVGQILTGSGLGSFAALLAFAPVGQTLKALLAACAGLFLTGTLLLVVSRLPDR